MKLVSNNNLIYLLLFPITIFFSCQEKDNHVKEQKYDKINFYKKDSFDLRIEKFLSRFDKSNDFALIDYGTCARCSEDKIDNFFGDLSKKEKIAIVFNDSAVFYKFKSTYPNVVWNYVDAKFWKKMRLESSMIVRYKRINDKHFKRIL